MKTTTNTYAFTAYGQTAYITIPADLPAPELKLVRSADDVGFEACLRFDGRLIATEFGGATHEAAFAEFAREASTATWNALQVLSR